MKILWLAALALLVTPVHAQETATAPMGAFQISPAPCDAAAVYSSGWCADPIVPPVIPPPNPTIPPPPVITGPFATINTSKVQLTGTGVPNDIISVAIDSIRDPGLVTVQAGGNWTFNSNFTLANGPHVATAIQTNSVGPSAASNPLTFAVAHP
jgi:hypothetical protein